MTKLLCLLGPGLALLALAWSAGSAGAEGDPNRLFRALRPKLIIEIGEPEINACLRDYPDDFAIPEGFTEPRIAFSEGLVEVSALTQLFFVTTRVRVGMQPEIVNGKLRLVVRKIKAGPVPLPSSFHRGVADSIAEVINRVLANNDVELRDVVAGEGVVRVSAWLNPPRPPKNRENEALSP